jgi:PAS domain-containing protein
MPEEWKTIVQALEEQNRALHRDEEALLKKLPVGSESENALRESEEILAKAFQASPDWIAITTVNVEFNPAFERMLGYGPEEIRELTYAQITPEK